MQTNNQNKNTPSNKLIESKDIIFIWKMILKNLGFIIAIPLLAYAIGYVYTYRLTNIYGAKAELLLKSNETYDYQDPIYKGLGAYGVYMDVQNQIHSVNKDLQGVYNNFDKPLVERYWLGGLVMMYRKFSCSNLVRSL